jgi:hypothetical protein
MISVGDVDSARNGFDPSAMLTDWETGAVSQLPDGRTLRTFEIGAVDREIEIAPGIMFPAWTYNGRVPGPSLRVTEGDRVRIVFLNGGSHPHSMHFHGIHSARVDGVPGAGVIAPGEAVPNDYYIRDESKKQLTYLVAPDARVTVLTNANGTIRSTRITAAELARIAQGRNPNGRKLYGRTLGYWIRVTGDTVRRLDQQYQP